jgi:hypothetical protein
MKAEGKEMEGPDRLAAASILSFLPHLSNFIVGC